MVAPQVVDGLGAAAFTVAASPRIERLTWLNTVGMEISDPDDLNAGHVVVVRVLRHDRNAVGDRGSSDPAVVDRDLTSRRSEPRDKESPRFGHRLVHGEGVELLRELVRRQSAGCRFGILSLQDAEPQLAVSELAAQETQEADLRAAVTPFASYLADWLIDAAEEFRPV